MTNDTLPQSKRFCNITGNRYNKFTVISFQGLCKRGSRLWLCRCDCGVEKNIRGSSLTTNNIKSCGCILTRLPKDRPLTQSILKEIVHYDPDTGVFTWRIRTVGHIKIGDIAGSIQGKTRICINIAGKAYRAHRLAWLYMYGAMPTLLIDHINGNGLDNRIVNLREATQSQNLMNRGKTIRNTSGFKGVHKHENKWEAQCVYKKIRKRMGGFNTPEEASVAYEQLAKECHGEFYYQSTMNKPEN